VLLPAAIFGDGGMTAEETIVDGGDCVGMKFDALRPEEAGRRARLGVLNFTFCSEGRGKLDGGFEGVGFSEASLLKGRIEDIFLSLGVVWRAVKGLLNGSENETRRTKKPTVDHSVHRPDPHRPLHRCIYTRWCERHGIHPSLLPQGARDPSEDKPGSNCSSR